MRSTARLDSLTSLRWFAAFGVFLFHIAGYAPIRQLAPLCALGYEGVPFFFLLSGFVLTWSVTPGDTAARFYWRRFARIWPLLAAVTVPALLIQHFWEHGPIRAADVAYTLTMTQAWTRQHFYTADMVTWTLSCEAFFYLLFPPLVLALIRLRTRWLAAVAAAALGLTVAGRVYAPHSGLSFTAARLLYASPAALAPMFVVGMCTALAVRRGWRPPVGVGGAVLLLAGAVAVLWVWALHPGWVGAWPGPGNTDALFLALFALLVAAVAVRDASGAPSLLRHPALVRLGEVSFAFYLVHLLVLNGFRHFSPHHPAANGDNVLWAAACLSVGCAAAWLGHTLVERPAERRLRRVCAVGANQRGFGTQLMRRLPQLAAARAQPDPRADVALTSGARGTARPAHPEREPTAVRAVPRAPR